MPTTMTEKDRTSLSDNVSPEMSIAVRNIEDELWYFEWMDYGGVSGAEFYFEEKEDGSVMIMMTVWVQNSDDFEDEEVRPLNAGISIDPYLQADLQIRALIHTFICHEADERLFFGEKHERRFYPDHPKPLP